VIIIRDKWTGKDFFLCGGEE